MVLRCKDYSIALLLLSLLLSVLFTCTCVFNHLLVVQDAYIKAQSVLLLSSQASASTDVQQQQQATTLAVNYLAALASSLTTEDAVNVLYQVVSAPGRLYTSGIALAGLSPVVCGPYILSNQQVSDLSITHQSTTYVCSSSLSD